MEDMNLLAEVQFDRAPSNHIFERDFNDVSPLADCAVGKSRGFHVPQDIAKGLVNLKGVENLAFLSSKRMCCIMYSILQQY